MQLVQCILLIPYHADRGTDSNLRVCLTSAQKKQGHQVFPVRMPTHVGLGEFYGGLARGTGMLIKDSSCGYFRQVVTVVQFMYPIT